MRIIIELTEKQKQCLWKGGEITLTIPKSNNKEVEESVKKTPRLSIRQLSINKYREKLA